MSNNVEEEVEELKRIVEGLVREVEALKESVKPKTKEVQLELKGSIEGRPFLDQIFEVLEKMLRDKPDAGLVFIGGVERRGGKIANSYFSSIELKDVVECPSRKIAKVVASLSNENRIRILQELLKGDKTSSELSSNLMLEGGQLYHHLKELMLAGYVEAKERGKYTLTSRGCIVIRTIAGLASIPGIITLAPEEVEEGLKEAK
ncbi:MAG: winged helix-turn-helix domain-containing protein [Candidatus Bathyarchaeia archaeon]